MKTFVLIIFSLLILSGCNNSRECEQEIYLIPEGFRGKIVVFFDQEDGQEKHYDNYARVYRIPESGYLKSQFPKNGGCMNDNRIRFYYKDGNEIGEELDYFLDLDKDSIPTDRDYVLFTFLSSENEPHFVIHFVGHISEFNELTNSVRNMDIVNILDSL